MVMDSLVNMWHPLYGLKKKEQKAIAKLEIDSLLKVEFPFLLSQFRT